MSTPSKRVRRFRLGARLLQLYFVFGLLGLAGVWFFYSQFLLLRLGQLWQTYANTLAAELENDTQLRSRIYAKFMSRATEPSEGGSPELDIIFEEVIRKLDFPVIITDGQGRPVSWRNLAVSEPDSSELEQAKASLARQHEPVPLLVADGDTTRRLGEIYYGLSASTVTLHRVSSQLAASVRSLRIFSLLQVFLLVGFVIVGIWGILAYKRREQEHIWTALAKETAHQLATPLSSFSAWLDVVRQRAGGEVADEMAVDLARMQEILDRFSRIGLPPRLSPQRLGQIIEHVVAFVRRRTSRAVAFTVRLDDDPLVPVDGVLFSWMLENLLKNAVDAIGSNSGVITVRTACSLDRRYLEIEVTDTGEGVKTDKIFDPGVTAKKYGWGVGLTLARRIVESYHGGRLILKESRPSRTIFSILLPVAESVEKEGC